MHLLLSMTPANDNELFRLLGDIVARSRDAHACYAAAIDRLGPSNERLELCHIMQDHARHAAHLTLLLHTLKGGLQNPAPLRYSHASIPPPPSGETREVLQLLRHEEALVSHAYAEAVAHPMAPWARAIVERGLHVERQHAARLDAWLGRAA